MSVLDLMATIGLDTSKYEAGMSKVGSVASGAMKVAGAAMAAATTAVVGIGAASVKTGMEFDSSMSQVAATMGLTMDEMETQVGEVDLAWGTFSGNLREYAQEMGKNTAFSAKEASDALNYMALAGYDVQTSMEMLPNVLNLAAAGNFELARASDMVTDTQTAFGISIERTAQMVDEMAKAASTGNTSVEQLGDAFLVVGGLAQELNGGMVTLADGTTAEVDGVQELEIALTAMANAGVKGSEAGTHMRNMLLKLASPTSDGTIALENMGVAVFDTEGKMRSLSDIFGDLSEAMDGMTQEEKISAISDLFNTRDIASAEALLNAVGEDWDKIGASILEADGAAQQMAETQLDNLAGDVTLFKSALEGAKIAISDSLTPTLREFVQFGTNGISELTTAFQEGGLSGAMSKLGEILADGLNMLMDMLPEIVEAAIGLLDAFVQGIMDNSTMILMAIGDIVTMIFDKLLESTSEGEPVIVQIIDDIVGVFAENYTQLIDVGLQIIVNLVKGISDNLPHIISEAEMILIDFGNALIDHLPELIQSGFEIIAALIEGITSNLPEIISTAVELITTLALSLTEPDNLMLLLDAALELMLALVQGIIDALPQLIEAAPKIIQNLVDGIVKALPRIIDAGIELIMALIDAILGNLGLIIKAAIEIIVALAGGLIEAIPDLIVAIPEIIMAIVTALLENIPTILGMGVQILLALVEGILSMLGHIGQAGAELITRFIEAISKMGGKLTEFGKKIAENFKKSFIEPLQKAKEWGKDLIENFVAGIKEKIQRVKEAVGEVAQKVKDLLGFSEPEDGPLSNFHTYAPDMMDLFAKGVKDNEGKLRAQISSSFDFGSSIAAPAGYGNLNYGGTSQQTVVLMLDKNELGRVVYDLNKAETTRMGVRLDNV